MPTLFVLLVAGLFFGWWIYNSIHEEIASVTENDKVRCPMNGVYVSKDKAEKRPLAVMVENSTAARPQSGLDKADLVYEALAEGGITRMMAVYACGGDSAKNIGPVRSARPYFVDWVEGFDAIYVHAGGSPQALDQIKDDKVEDINNYGDGVNFIRSSDRSSPHNLYTSYTGIINLAKKFGYKLTGKYKELNFKDDAATEDRPASQEVVINFSSLTYQAKWTYNKSNNSYSRYLAGLPHKDLVTGKQITAKTIIVEEVDQRPIPGGSSRLEMDTVGSGDAVIIQDGKATEGSWEKKFVGDRTTYYDASGNEIALTAGTIWIEIVKPGTSLSY